jgi:hypothetical protein
MGAVPYMYGYHVHIASWVPHECRPRATLLIAGLLTPVSPLSSNNSDSFPFDSKGP